MDMCLEEAAAACSPEVDTATRHEAPAIVY